MTSVKKNVLFERKTYVHGTVVAKYRGRLDESVLSRQLVNEKVYNIEVYDAVIKDCKVQNDTVGPFTFPINNVYVTKMPKLLECEIFMDNSIQNYKIEMNEVRIANVDFGAFKTYHIVEGKEVFGMFRADITGFISEKRFKEVDVEIDEEISLPLLADVEKNTNIANPRTNYWGQYRNNKRWNRRYNNSYRKSTDFFWSIIGFFLLIIIIGGLGFKGILLLILFVFLAFLVVMLF